MRHLSKSQDSSGPCKFYLSCPFDWSKFPFTFLQMLRVNYLSCNFISQHFLFQKFNSWRGAGKRGLNQMINGPFQIRSLDCLPSLWIENLLSSHSKFCCILHNEFGE